MSMKLVECRAVIKEGDYLWENIFPRNKATGTPSISPSGKYMVRMFVMNAWRAVTVDDTIPLDLFGRPLLVCTKLGLQLWPLLLTKAVLKLMTQYETPAPKVVIPDMVPAFFWLSGWLQESIPREPRYYTYDRIAAAIAEQKAWATCCMANPVLPEKPICLMVLCGPRAIGKRAIISQLEAQFPTQIGRAITHTTRFQAEGEAHGVHYHFVTPDAFAQGVQAKQFIESSERFGGITYGTSFSAVRDVAVSGRVCIVGLDLAGAEKVKATPMGALFIYVRTPSLEDYEALLRAHLTITDEALEKRLDRAEMEVAQSATPGLFDNNFPNGDVMEAYYGLKLAAAELSPIVRSKLKGHPSYVLDYSDVVPANMTEKAFPKPLVVSGPGGVGKSTLIGMLLEEFPAVFALPRVVTTSAAAVEAAAAARAEAMGGNASSNGDENYPGDTPPVELVSREFILDAIKRWEGGGVAAVPEPVAAPVKGKGGAAPATPKGKAAPPPPAPVAVGPKVLSWKEVNGELYAVMDAALEEVHKSGRISILEMELRFAERLRFDNQPGIYAFVAPPPPTRPCLEQRLRRIFRLTDAEVAAELALAKEEFARVDAGDPNFVCDHVITRPPVGPPSTSRIAPLEEGGEPVLIDPGRAPRAESLADALEQMKALVSHYRPDVIPASMFAAPVDAQSMQRPLALCGLEGVPEKAALLSRLAAEYGDKVAVLRRHTTSATHASGECKALFQLRARDDMEMDNAMAKYVEYVRDYETNELFATPRDEMGTAQVSGKLPVLALSASDVERIRDDGNSLGMVFVLLRPKTVEAMRGWAGLEGAVGGPDAAVEAAEKDAGLWERHPEWFDHQLELSGGLVDGPSDNLEAMYLDLKELLARLVPEHVPPPPPVFIISGPDGGGSKALLNSLVTEFPGSFAFPESYTTREVDEEGREDTGDAGDGANPPPPSAVTFRHMDADAMERGIAEGWFVEHATVEEVHPGTGKLVQVTYATTKESVRRLAWSGKVPVLDLDVAGVRRARSSGVRSLSVFLRPRSLEYIQGELTLQGCDVRHVRARVLAAGTELAAADAAIREVNAAILAAGGQVPGTSLGAEAGRGQDGAGESAGAKDGTEQGGDGDGNKEGADGISSTALLPLANAASSSSSSAGSLLPMFDLDIVNDDADVAYAIVKKALHEQCPQVVPLKQVWGYGRLLWVPEERQIGSHPLQVVVNGPPGSGKTTVAMALAKSYGIPFVSLGELMQAEIARGTPLGKAAKEAMDKSTVVPDDIVVELVTARVTEIDCRRKGWVLDGVPRTKSQVALLRQRGIRVHKYVLLDVSDDKCMERIRGRRMDPVTGDVYHLEQMPPPKDKPEIAARLVQRHDDRDAITEQRLDHYFDQLHALQDYVCDFSVTVDGTTPVSTILQKIRTFVELEADLGTSVAIGSAKDLLDLEYSVVSAMKFRGECLFLLRADGGAKEVWVRMHELCPASRALMLSRDTRLFPQVAAITRESWHDLAPAAQALVSVDVTARVSEVSLTLSLGPTRNVGRPVDAAIGCTALVEEVVDWRSLDPPALIRQLSTKTISSATIKLPRGRHFLRTTIDPGMLYSVTFHSLASVAVDTPQNVLAAAAEAQGGPPFHAQVLEGTFGPLAPGDFSIWFRQLFRVDTAGAIIAVQLLTTQEAVEPLLKLLILDNDTGRNVVHALGHVRPQEYPPNKNGYTVIGAVHVPHDPEAAAMLAAANAAANAAAAPPGKPSTPLSPKRGAPLSPKSPISPRGQAAPEPPDQAQLDALLALSPAPQGGRWRLSIMSSSYLAEFTTLPSEQPTTVEATYTRNKAFLVAKYRIMTAPGAPPVGAPWHLALHLVMSHPGIAFTVSLLKWAAGNTGAGGVASPDKGGAKKAAAPPPAKGKGGAAPAIPPNEPPFVGDSLAPMEEVARWQAVDCFAHAGLVLPALDGSPYMLRVALDLPRCTPPPQPGKEAEWVPDGLKVAVSMLASTPVDVVWDDVETRLFAHIKNSWAAVEKDRQKRAAAARDEFLAKQREAIANGGTPPEPVVKKPPTMEAAPPGKGGKGAPGAKGAPAKPAAPSTPKGKGGKGAEVPEVPAVVPLDPVALEPQRFMIVTGPELVPGVPTERPLLDPQGYEERGREGNAAVAASREVITGRCQKRTADVGEREAFGARKVMEFMEWRVADLGQKHALFKEKDQHVEERMQLNRPVEGG
eukprot:jgi/Mesvir1/27724/Mv07422-RA.2